jgi:transposase
MNSWGPTLQQSDIVIVNNLGSYKVAKVRAAIEAEGATQLYLPPYSSASILSKTS